MEDAEELRKTIAELMEERDWTRRQHRRWGQERAALLATIRELRRHAGASAMEPSPGRSTEPAILLALPFLTVGGAEAVLSRLCRDLREIGFRIFVVTTVPALEYQGDSSEWFRSHVAGIYHLPLLFEARVWRPFLFFLIEQQSIRVLWQAGSSYIYDLLPELKQWFPALAVVDLLFNPVGHTANHLKYAYLIDHAVTESQSMKQWLAGQGRDEASISVIPNGVDLALYLPPRRHEHADKFLVAFFGRLAEEKAPDIFLEIAARLVQHSKLEFLLCGGGPMESELRQRAYAMGIAGRVQFPGFVATAEYLGRCDVVVVCSRLDGRPNIILESMAAGVPVVASRVGDIPSLVPDGVAGSLCAPGDVDAFCRAILALAENPARHREFGLAARSHAEAHFSGATAAGLYAGLFRRLTNRAAVRPQRSRRRLWKLLLLALSPFQVRRTAANLRLLRRLRRHPEKARQLEDLFDGAWYRAAYPDVAAAGVPPLLHYVLCGFAEGRNPSPRFHTRSYLEKHPEVARAQLNPLLHYVMQGGSIVTPAGTQRFCPVCAVEVQQFLPLGEEYFEEAARTGFLHPWDRWEMLNCDEYSCPCCWASDRDRLMALFLHRRLDRISPGEPINLVEFAPTPPLANFLRNDPRVRYRSAGLSEDGVDDRVDLMDLSVYPDAAFDAFLCSHVLEHVPDDQRAMSELRRILKPGGWGIVLVPISLAIEGIRECPEAATPDERWKHFGQHDHARLYNREGFVCRLEAAGFDVERVGIDYFGAESFHRHGIAKSSALYVVR